MKPSYTCNVARTLLKHLGSDIRTTAEGAPDGDLTLPNPSSFPDAQTFKKAWLAYNLVRKRVVEQAGPELSKKALDSFLERESVNADLNRGPAREAWVGCYLLAARQFVADVVGDKPNLRSVYQNSVFTGGASSSRTRSMAHPALKWWARPALDVTPLALKHLLGFARESEVLHAAWGYPGWLSTQDPGQLVPFFNVVPGSVFQTVPKDYKTDRSIMVEPDGNMLLQRGVGVTFRESLRKVGCNLRDQSRNRRLAREGSIKGNYATLDLSNASNSVYLRLVVELLPDPWIDLLYELRSHVCRLPDGRWHSLEMISSMGNGYTFELESLIFLALATAVVRVNRLEGEVSVYGDDIIVPTAAAPILIDLMRCLGLEVNSDKTYVDGPFRESCGGHYFRGQNVTPFYIKGDLNAMGTCLVANQYHCWSTAGTYVPLDGAHYRMYEALVQGIPRDLRVQVPLQYSGDSGLYGYQCATSPIRRRITRRGWCSVVFRTLRVEKSVLDRFDDECKWLFTHMQRGYTGLTRHPLLQWLYVTSGSPPLTLNRDGELVKVKTVVKPSPTVGEWLRPYPAAKQV